MFEALMHSIWEEFARLIFHVEVEVAPQAQEQFAPAERPLQVDYSGGGPEQPSALGQAAVATAAGPDVAAEQAIEGRAHGNGAIPPSRRRSSRTRRTRSAATTLLVRLGQEVQEVPRRLSRARDDLLGHSHRPVQRRLLEAGGRSHPIVVAGVDAPPDLDHRARQTRQLELAVVGVAGARVARPADRDPGAPGGGEDLALDALRGRRARASGGRSACRGPPCPPRARSEGRRARPLGLDRLDERRGPDVVGRSRHHALLGARGDEPDVALGLERRRSSRSQAHQHPDARGVVDWRRAPEERCRCAPSGSAGSSRAVSSRPITLRDCPRPGTRNPLTLDIEPGRRGTAGRRSRARAARSRSPRDGSRSCPRCEPRRRRRLGALAAVRTDAAAFARSAHGQRARGEEVASTRDV